MPRTTARLDGATLVLPERDASPISLDTPACLPSWSTQPHSRLQPIQALHRPQGAAGSRRRALLRLMASGNSNAEVARALVIATSTVKPHTNSTFSKLRVTSRTQASALARDLYLL
jgi:DNA-binding NarL/FixJ family response regulator